MFLSTQNTITKIQANVFLHNCNANQLASKVRLTSFPIFANSIANIGIVAGTIYTYSLILFSYGPTAVFNCLIQQITGIALNILSWQLFQARGDTPSAAAYRLLDLCKSFMRELV